MIRVSIRSLIADTIFNAVFWPHPRVSSSLSVLAQKAKKIHVDEVAVDPSGVSIYVWVRVKVTRSLIK